MTTVGSGGKHSVAVWSIQVAHKCFAYIYKFCRICSLRFNNKKLGMLVYYIRIVPSTPVLLGLRTKTACQLGCCYTDLMLSLSCTGVMPVMTYGGFKRMTTFCKTQVPAHITETLEGIKDNDEAVKVIGGVKTVIMCPNICRSGKQPHLSLPGPFFSFLVLMKSRASHSAQINSYLGQETAYTHKVHRCRMYESMLANFVPLYVCVYLALVPNQLHD